MSHLYPAVVGVIARMAAQWSTVFGVVIVPPKVPEHAQQAFLQCFAEATTLPDASRALQALGLVTPWCPTPEQWKYINSPACGNPCIHAIALSLRQALVAESATQIVEKRFRELALRAESSQKHLIGTGAQPGVMLRGILALGEEQCSVREELEIVHAFLLHDPSLTLRWLDELVIPSLESLSNSEYTPMLLPPAWMEAAHRLTASLSIRGSSGMLWHCLQWLLYMRAIDHRKCSTLGEALRSSPMIGVELVYLLLLSLMPEVRKVQATMHLELALLAN